MSTPAKLSAAYLRSRIDAGDRIAEIARATGYGRETVLRHCRVHGIATHRVFGPRRKLPPTNEIIDRLRAGEKAAKIADEADVTPCAVTRALARSGLGLLNGQVFQLKDI